MILKTLSCEAMEKVIFNTDFYSWIKQLNAYDIYAPVKTGGIWSYELMENPEKLL